MAKLSIWTQDKIDGYSLCVCGKPSSMFVSDISVNSDTAIQNAVITVPFSIPLAESVNCLVEKTGRNEFEITVPKEFEKTVNSSTSRGKKAYVRADTYENGVYLGSFIADVYCVVDTDVYKPIITEIAVSKGKMLDNKLLKGHSTVSISISIDDSQLNGSRISKVEVTLGKQILSATKSIFSSKYTATFTTTETGSFTPSVVVTDGRGTKAYGKGALVSVFDYSFPQVDSVLVQRCLKNGNIDDDGLYVAMTAKFTYASVGASNSIATTQVFTKPRVEKDYALSCSAFSNNTPVVFGGEFDVKKGYDIKVVVTDKAGNSSTYVDYITTGSVAIELFRNQAAAFGKPVEKTDGLELAEKWKLYTHEDVYHDKDVYVGGKLKVVGDVTVDGEIISKPQNMYQTPGNQSPDLFTVTEMSEDSFVIIDFLIMSISNTSILAPVTMIIHYYGSQAYVDIYLPNENVDMWDMHVTWNRVAKGAKISARISGGKVVYKINSVAKSNINIKTNYLGTKL